MAGSLRVRRDVRGRGPRRARSRAVMAVASRPSAASSCRRSPCSTNRSGSPSVQERPCSAGRRPAPRPRALPAPPATAFSSTVTRSSWRARQVEDQLDVQRLHEAHVDDRRVERFAASSAVASMRAEREQRDAVRRAGAPRRVPIGKRGQRRRDRRARRRCRAGSARRSGPSSASPVDSMRAALVLVGGRHHHDVRDAAQVREVEGAVVGGAVVADQAGAVDGEQHRQVLQRHVVDQLVVAALQEGRVDRHHRAQALAGQAGGEGHARAARRCRRRRSAPGTAARSAPCPSLRAWPA